MTGMLDVIMLCVLAWTCYQDYVRMNELEDRIEMLERRLRR